MLLLAFAAVMGGFGGAFVLYRWVKWSSKGQVNPTLIVSSVLLAPVIEYLFSILVAMLRLNEAIIVTSIVVGGLVVSPCIVLSVGSVRTCLRSARPSHILVRLMSGFFRILTPLLVAGIVIGVVILVGIATELPLGPAKGSELAWLSKLCDIEFKSDARLKGLYVNRSIRDSIVLAKIEVGRPEALRLMRLFKKLDPFGTRAVPIMYIRMENPPRWFDLYHTRNFAVNYGQGEMRSETVVSLDNKKRGLIYLFWKSDRSRWWGNNCGFSQHPSLRWMAIATSIEFPRSTKLVGSQLQLILMSGSLAARLKMDGADAEKLLKELSPRSKISRTDRLSLSNSNTSFEIDPAWWNPDSVDKFVSVLVGDEGRCRLLISLDKKNEADVYLIQH